MNVNMVDDEKAKKNVEVKKGKPLYNPFEQEEEGEFGEVRIETWRAGFCRKLFAVDITWCHRLRSFENIMPLSALCFKRRFCASRKDGAVERV